MQSQKTQYSLNKLTKRLQRNTGKAITEDGDFDWSFIDPGWTR